MVNVSTKSCHEVVRVKPTAPYPTAAVRSEAMPTISAYAIELALIVPVATRTRAVIR